LMASPARGRARALGSGYPAGMHGEAADLSWTCTTVTAPADVVPWRLATPASDEELGAAQAGRDAFDALYARVDAECLADCVMPLAYACPERTCVTPAGDLVTWSTEETGSSVVSVLLAVEPDPRAGLGWTRAEVTRSRSSDLATIWRVNWEGVLDARWPTDGAFEASVTDPGSSRTREWWSDATCRWATETGWVESPPVVRAAMRPSTRAAASGRRHDARDVVRFPHRHQGGS